MPHCWARCPDAVSCPPDAVRFRRRWRFARRHPAFRERPLHEHRNGHGARQILRPGEPVHTREHVFRNSHAQGLATHHDPFSHALLTMVHTLCRLEVCVNRGCTRLSKLRMKTPPCAKMAGLIRSPPDGPYVSPAPRPSPPRGRTVERPVDTYFRHEEKVIQDDISGFRI